MKLENQFIIFFFDNHMTNNSTIPVTRYFNYSKFISFSGVVQQGLQHLYMKKNRRTVMFLRDHIYT